MRLFRTAPILFAAALAVAACGRDAGRAPEAGDQVVATVQGDTVWASDVKREAVAQGLIAETEALAPTSDLFRRVLDEVIDQKLLAREAERRGLDASPQARRRLEATRDRILGDILVETEVNQAINDRAVQTIYREQARQAQTQDEIRSRLILTRTEADADAVVGLLAQGADFAAVAQERSIDDATRFSGGDLGYATPDVLPQAYAQALEGQAAGALVGPFQTEGGWAVLKVEDRRKETPPTLEQARPQIVRYLTYEGVRQLIEDLRGKAEIELRPQQTRAAPARAPAPAKAAS